LSISESQQVWQGLRLLVASSKNEAHALIVNKFHRVR
jgi:hypothetical protein